MMRLSPYKGPSPPAGKAGQGRSGACRQSRLQQQKGRLDAAHTHAAGRPTVMNVSDAAAADAAASSLCYTD